MKLIRYSLLNLFLISAIAHALCAEVAEVKNEINKSIETYVFHNPGNFKFIIMIDQIQTLINSHLAPLQKEFGNEFIAKVLALLQDLKVNKNAKAIITLIKDYKDLLPKHSLLRVKPPSVVMTNFCYHFSTVG